MGKKSTKTFLMHLQYVQIYIPDENFEGHFRGEGQIDNKSQKNVKYTISSMSVQSQKTGHIDLNQKELFDYQMTLV